MKSVWTIYSMNFFIIFSAATCLFQNEPNAFRHFGNGIVNPELGNGGFLGWRFRVNSVVAGRQVSYFFLLFPTFWGLSYFVLLLGKIPTFSYFFRFLLTLIDKNAISKPQIFFCLALLSIISFSK